MQSQCGNGTLVTYVEYDAEVGFQSIVKPLYFCWLIHRLRVKHHKIFSLWVSLAIYGVKFAYTAVRILQGLSVATINVGKISTVGVCVGTLKQLTFKGVARYTVENFAAIAMSAVGCSRGMRLQTRTHRHHCEQCANHPWQSKAKHAALTLFTFYRDRAAVEYLTYLLVLVDDTLAVEQSEAMRCLHVYRRRIDNLAFEQVCPLFLGHSHASICNNDIHIAFFNHSCTKCNAIVRFCKLTRIIYQRVNHKER